jgi:transcriptional regulator with XRE-family HTH domain
MIKDPFRAEIAQKFKEAIATLRISKAQAARDLNVSRQMLYEYLGQKSTPKHSVLRRACVAWNLELDYKGLIVNSSAFPPAITPRVADVHGPWQLDLDLQTAIEHLRDEDLLVRILRKDNGRIELRVELKFLKTG